MSDAVHDLTHVTDGKAKLLSFLKGKPNLDSLLGVYLAEVQSAEDALWQLLTQRYALTSPPTGQSIAQGLQLDGIGDIVVQPRNGLNDSDYISALLSKIAVNTASGLINEIENILSGFLLSNGFTLIQSFPAQFIINFTHPMSTANANLATSLIGTAKAAGVGGLAIYQGPSTNDNQVFLLGSASQGLDQGLMKVGVWT